ncbi:MAG: TonB family protein, partial [Proteobacteria bacterium]|nr:TonB family protein [Pseudomonadota bacterium]MBU1570184.1 TonB family protein [Pseudomonadota bacterium]
IPVSMIVKQHVQEIELFVAIEDAHMQQMPIKKQHEIVKPVIEKKMEPEKTQEVVKPVEVQLHKEKQSKIMEPAKEIIQPSAEAPAEPSRSSAVQSVPAESSAEPGRSSAVQSAPVESFSEPVKTEFGTAAAPSFLHREMPVYPAFARKLGKEGEVVLRLTIDERGNLLNVEVLETAEYGFTEAAVDAVKKSTFLPAKKNGKPVASRALLPVRFILRRS